MRSIIFSIHFDMREWTIYLHVEQSIECFPTSRFIAFELEKYGILLKKTKQNWYLVLTILENQTTGVNLYERHDQLFIRIYDLTWKVYAVAAIFLNLPPLITTMTAYVMQPKMKEEDWKLPFVIEYDFFFIETIRSYECILSFSIPVDVHELYMFLIIYSYSSLSLTVAVITKLVTIEFAFRIGYHLTACFKHIQDSFGQIADSSAGHSDKQTTNHSIEPQWTKLTEIIHYQVNLKK